jgi:hypothetical protein
VPSSIWTGAISFEPNGREIRSLTKRVLPEHIYHFVVDGGYENSRT